MSVRPPRARLRLQPLADRSLPSTFTVTNLLDSGPGSLRQAVLDANANPGADDVAFAVTGTIPLTGGQLDITDSLTVSGPGESALTVSGESLSRVFGIAGAPTVVVANLTVANGRTTDSPGGGLFVAGGTVTLDHVTVTGNSAAGSPGVYDHIYGSYSVGQGLGGGLYVAGGTLTLDQSTVSGNQAVGGQGWGGPGTGVQSGYPGGRSDGGGLYVAGGTVYVNQSAVSGNRAQGGQGGDGDWQYWVYLDNTYGGHGGDAAGGGLCVTGGRLEVRESTVSGNTAVGGDGGWGDYYGWPGTAVGGGMFLASAAPPRADLDPFTVGHTVGNTPDDIAGPYSLNGQPPPPDLAVADASVVEGHAGTTALVFRVTLSAASTQPVTVGWATADGTATAGSDYQAASGTLTFAPGETAKAIAVPVSGDRLGEPNETFVVNLSSPTNATMADGQGIGTVVDDEPRISIGTVTKAEGRKNHTTLFTFTVTLSAAYDQAVTVSFRTVDGTATTGDGDYVARTGTITFLPGETTKTITIEVKGDSKREADEYFYLDLFGNSSNSLFTNTRGIGTILNDD
jgi:Calx-beta domain